MVTSSEHDYTKLGSFPNLKIAVLETKFKIFSDIISFAILLSIGSLMPMDEKKCVKES
jgi:hypothetical protein